MGNRYIASKLTLEHAQKLDALQRDGSHSWSDILREYGVSRYQIKRRLDEAQQIRNIRVSAASLQPVAAATLNEINPNFLTTETAETDGRFIKPRFIPDCLACHKQTASLQYNGYFCSLECAAIWALDYLQTSTTPEWCPFCKTWLKIDMPLLQHIYSIHPLNGIGEEQTHES